MRIPISVLGIYWHHWDCRIVNYWEPIQGFPDKLNYRPVMFYTMEDQIKTKWRNKWHKNANVSINSLIKCYIFLFWQLWSSILYQGLTWLFNRILPIHIPWLKERVTQLKMQYSEVHVHQRLTYSLYPIQQPSESIRDLLCLPIYVLPARLGYRYAIVLDSNSFLCLTDHAWCNWANQEDQKAVLVLFENIS